MNFVQELHPLAEKDEQEGTELLLQRVQTKGSAPNLKTKSLSALS